MTQPAPAPTAKEPAPLPRLRQDLTLMPGATSGSGSDAWLLYDPLRHRYTQIDKPTFTLLSLWQRHATARDLAVAAQLATGTLVSIEEIDRLTQFLEQNSLTESAASLDGRKLRAEASKHSHTTIMWLIHNYLFLKIPLVSPEAFLKRTLPVVAPLFRRNVQLGIAALGVVGLYLVSRQWDAFLKEASGLASLHGLLSIGAVLFVVKAFHELGHAYTAVRFGCRVPSIGLAFMMMAPMLYTDVTDAWRLQDRRKRLAIDSAGIAVELGLACLATLLWVFLPEGGARHVAFLIATTSWIMSVAVNLNPLMRFDGYYLLSDMLRIDNLQSRAFSLGQWRLREALFGVNAPCPEALPARMRVTLIVYAYAIWIYRLVLFTGIALLVYHYFFKALGVFLFLFEIGYFIVRPIVRETTIWWKMRNSIAGRRRVYLTGAALCGLAGLLLIPWSSRVRIPALVEGDNLVRIYASRPARVSEVLVANGAPVSAGDVLFRLEAPDLAHERTLARSKLSSTELRLKRHMIDGAEKNELQVLERERESLKIELAGLDQQLERLTITAPVAGRIVELPSFIKSGVWINPKLQIALIDGSKQHRAIAYIQEGGVWRVAQGARGTFIPEVPLATSRTVTVHEVGAAASARINTPELVLANGGPIETEPDTRQGYVPTIAQVQLVLEVAREQGMGDALSLPTSERGTIMLDAEPSSILSSLWRSVLKVLVRESGI